MLDIEVSPKLYDNHADELERRKVFDGLMVEWERMHTAYRDHDTPSDVIREIERKYPEETRLAYAILTAPAPHPTLLYDKLRVILHYMQTAGADLYPHERIALMGLHALMVDLRAMHG